MYAALVRRSRKYLRNWSVTASASSTVAAASTLSATPLSGPWGSWPAKSIRRRAVQRILPPSGGLERLGRPSTGNCFDSLTMLSGARRGAGWGGPTCHRGTRRSMRRSSLTLNTIALEVVPPNADRGREQALEEAHKVLQLSAKSGISGRIGHVMMPGLIEEDDDRPIEMKPKLDVLDFWSIIKPELPGVSGLCSQVTAFMDEPTLRGRLTALGDSGIEGIAFVGVPRTMNDGEGSGVASTDALSIFDELVD